MLSKQMRETWTLEQSLCLLASIKRPMGLLISASDVVDSPQGTLLAAIGSRRSTSLYHEKIPVLALSWLFGNTTPAVATLLQLLGVLP
mmetsp:Transcript_3643/g.8399  ORF Transcript_3643/g.8399 Transcript_3643/m.8399 type:complete len:88 (-) Transcript_3643:1088-1351(-)